MPRETYADLELTHRVLHQASAWGYRCACQEPGIWQIRPEETRDEPWMLQSWEGRWLLLIHCVPQISFYPEEALSFMERHRHQDTSSSNTAVLHRPR
ncbi:hypothetical protein [Anthocerotibacter panamensis]|uniref:hypothetical protein n=1 Tax=Anthocerotibacter panamensis TaxID=2857077 RepID=UPI001C4053FF|nr:hypothetical protein [Anthocerotibacter panamensis]